MINYLKSRSVLCALYNRDAKLKLIVNSSSFIVDKPSASLRPPRFLELARVVSINSESTRKSQQLIIECPRHALMAKIVRMKPV